MQISKITLSDQIYKVLKTEIMTQEIPFGSKLINRSLQLRFGVSSSPIRDAINHLSQDGLIASIDNTGARVVEFDYNFFLEINEVLMYVVMTGVKLSFEKADVNEVCKHLDKSISFQEKSIGTDKFYDYDYRFHKTFIIYSKNSRLKKLFKEYNVLHEVLVRNFYGETMLEAQEESIAMHKRITEAYRNKDTDLAKSLTEKHYKDAEEKFKDILEQREEDFQDDELDIN